MLPLAFSDRCHALAQQAATGKAISAADVTWLASHRAARMNRGDVAVLEAMARISRYLDQPFNPKADLLEQVRDYQRGGAFVDLATMQLRRALASSVHYHPEANRLLAACRERRDRENRHFAETLAGGYEAAGPRYIVGAGCEVPRGTPAENVRVLGEFARGQRP